MTSSDTPPTPRPTVHAPTGALHSPLQTGSPPPCATRSNIGGRRSPGGDDTRRISIADDDRTRPFVRRDALPNTPPDPEPADDLGFDRPLFPPPLPGLTPVVPLPSLASPDRPDTRESIEIAHYDRLVAATRREPPHAHPLDRDTFSTGPSVVFAPGVSGPEPVISDPWPLAQPPHPMEATQRPGSSPPSVAATIFPGRRHIITPLMAAAVLLAIAIGVLAGYLLRTFTAGTERPERSTVPAPSPLLRRTFTSRPRPRQTPIRTPAPAAPRATRTPRPPVPAIQQALARRQWRRAQRLLRTLPRHVRYQVQPEVWQAEVWHGIGRLADARYALQQVLRDSRLTNASLRLAATLRLSIVLLQCERRSQALRRAREALALAHQQGSDDLVARAEQQIARCVIAIQKQDAQ